MSNPDNDPEDYTLDGWGPALIGIAALILSVAVVFIARWLRTGSLL